MIPANREIGFLKHVRRSRQDVLAVGRVHEPALPDWPQAGLLHEPPYLKRSDLETAVGQRADQVTAAVTLAADYDRGMQMHARFVKVGVMARRLAP